MVKPDPDRDYYKDLGVANTADITEIKKQYKKLGKTSPSLLHVL